MTTAEFLRSHGASPEQISADDCLQSLLEDMRLGLQDRGKIPMLPSYLSTDISVSKGARCCVLDAGGTNLRTALASFSGNGDIRLEQLQTVPMPGTEGELSFDAFYRQLAAPLKKLGHFDRVGFCFSYNVTLERTLDGSLDFWCKEVQAPEAVGKPVGASLQKALGDSCRSVHVLNDSVAAMLGAGDAAHPVQVGVILGTGINVCYLERCEHISKIPGQLLSDTMIISTEIGEFDKIPKSDFDRAVIAGTDAPQSAHAEKQCSGGYLGQIITQAWRTAARDGLLPDSFRTLECDLSDISRFLAIDAVSAIPCIPEAADLAKALIYRAAKIAAILCAGPMVLTGTPEKILTVAVEGSQYWKLTGFRDAFHHELDALLLPYGLRYEILHKENACLFGAALAAFAKPM